MKPKCLTPFLKSTKFDLFSPMTHHVCPTSPVGGVIDKQVLGSSSKISSLRHHSLLHGLQTIDEYSWFGTNVQTVDISISLPQLRENTTACQFLKYIYRISHNRWILRSLTEITAAVYSPT